MSVYRVKYIVESEMELQADSMSMAVATAPLTGTARPTSVELVTETETEGPSAEVVDVCEGCGAWILDIEDYTTGEDCTLCQACSC